MSILGTRVLRIEDPRFLTSGGVYTEDVVDDRLTGACHVFFVRSPIAHARITGIDVSAALSAPGVIAAFTGADLADLPDIGPMMPALLNDRMRRRLLAPDVVRYVGDPVAAVVTEEPYQGEDAVELVDVDYAPLPAVISLADAASDEVVLFEEAGTNIAANFGDPAALDEHLFDDCDAVVSHAIVNQRVAPAPMETRAAAAVWGKDGRLTAWVPNQGAQGTRSSLAGLLGVEPEQIRVITPDVGGAFGAKFGADPEHAVVAWVARRLGRPARWTETRYENLIGMTHGRAQEQIVTIGGGLDGKVRAYRLEILQDAGAYPRIGAILPFLTILMTPGPYAFPRAEAVARTVVTTTTPLGAYRGAGRPEATAAVERAMDLFAAEIGMDPAEVRRRNFIAPDQFPFQTKTGARYDTGQYAEALDKVLTGVHYEELRQEQERRRARGDVRQLGIGVSTYVEITAADGAAGETAKLEVSDDGTATVYTGSSPHGQGHHTAWAMLVQEELGIPMDQVTVIHGDTDLIPVGVGTYASRSLQLGGSAVYKAAAEVKDEARHQAADMLEAAQADVVLDTMTGLWQVRGDPDTALSWAQVAGHTSGGSLIADVSFTADVPTFPFGAHVSVVEVDTETGKVTLLRHVTVDDAGPVLNPVLAEGQRHGGIAQGAAQAFLEEVIYDTDGNPLTSSFADYAFLSATEVPSFELADMETPTSYNPLGAKGIGEAGTIGATPAVQNAVVDAVAHLGVRHIDMPASPLRVWRALQAARAAGEPPPAAGPAGNSGSSPRTSTARSEGA